MNRKTSKADLHWFPNYISNLPLHLQLVKIVTRKITSQQIRSGDLLPAVLDLSTASCTAPKVIRAAYGILEKKGLIQKGRQDYQIRVN